MTHTYVPHAKAGRNLFKKRSGVVTPLVDTGPGPILDVPGVYAIQASGWKVHDMTGSAIDGDDHFGVGHAWVENPGGGSIAASAWWAANGGDGTIIRNAGSLSGNWVAGLVDCQFPATEWYGYDQLRRVVLYKDGVPVIDFTADWPIQHPA
jgi:hypothetical protein